MKLKTLFLLCLLAILPYSCRKEIKSEKGGIDLISNVYFDASKGLEQMQSFHLSKLNYLGNQIIEFVPDHSFPEINMQTYFIQDSLYYPVKDGNGSVILSEVAKTQKPQLVWNKKEGAIFSKEQILNYRNRRKLSDTVLFNKKYKRFEINSPWNYTRFYIYPTDTILPYSIYRHAEKDYGGRLERIDSYNKKTDIFVSLQLLPRKNWDDAAKEIFDFNHFVNSRKSE
ncbi:hypothetical protein H0S70_01510 [Chryseobacterium manosquense]|uniref:Uncharacterized protein n=1 Tax=Chryseobacterium manosquense TaxID=2754694 RepID=A0A7H1DXJ1_9FLAO|nr:hypothetical protein [Chryseobacterium manosquense]QNS41699.1 hypothetical protein H0S70_01510 [Chryseobacterium manosquense]